MNWLFWRAVKQTHPARKVVDRSTLVDARMDACDLCGRKHLTSVDRTGNRSIVGAAAQRRHDQAQRRHDKKILSGF